MPPYNSNNKNNQNRENRCPKDSPKPEWDVTRIKA